MNQVTVTSWNHLQDELFRDSWNDDIRRFRSPFVYRGQGRCDARLDTSLMRLGGPYADLERHLLRNFRKYGQSVAGEFGSIWHLLSLAQHHGLPTRLFDWTYSPYVALHFATVDLHEYAHDAVIWVVNFQKTHERLPAVLRQLLRDEGAQVFTIELLNNLPSMEVHEVTEEGSFREVIETLAAFDKLGRAEEFLLFFEPPSIDERIVNQYALFSVMPNSRRSFDDWLRKHPDLYRSIVIPAALKWECRDKLDQSNITERVLMPGLDGLSQWLKRHYSPRS